MDAEVRLSNAFLMGFNARSATHLICDRSIKHLGGQVESEGFVQANGICHDDTLIDFVVKANEAREVTKKQYTHCTMGLFLKGKGMLNNTATCKMYCLTKENAIKVAHDDDPS